MGKDKDKGKPHGHHVGSAHKRGGKGSWSYHRDEDEPGMKPGDTVPKGVRHGDVTDDESDKS